MSCCNAVLYVNMLFMSFYNGGVSHSHVWHCTKMLPMKSISDQAYKKSLSQMCLEDKCF